MIDIYIFLLFSLASERNEDCIGFKIICFFFHFFMAVNTVLNNRPIIIQIGYVVKNW